MARKKAKLSTAPSKITNNRDILEVKTSPWLEDYQDLFSFKMKPVTQGFIERLAHELNEWSKKDDSLVFVDFYGSRDIPDEAFYRWIRTYPELKNVHSLAKKRLAGRREVGGLTRKFDPSAAFNSLPMYDIEWKEFMQWKSNLKHSEENQQKVIVEINDISTKRVSDDVVKG